MNRRARHLPGPRAAAVALTALGLLLSAAPAGAASGRTQCVGSKHGCHAGLQEALDAARDGDTIVIGPGRFAGGVTISKSVRLVGSGRGRTVIKGGGPVLTIGEFLAPSQPTVSISGVTITGGLTASSPESQNVGKEGVIASGGGIEISPSADFGVGSTVTVKDSAVSRNRAAPIDTVPSGNAECPGGPCPFALARGAGIDTWGPLTLRNTVVSGNTAAGVASDAVGGGISVRAPGALTALGSEVVGNRALASEPNGRFAEGGGIFTDPEVELTVRGSFVRANEARLTSDLPYFVPGADPIDMNANGGGIHAGDGTSTTVDGTTIARNVVSVSDPNGRPYGFDSGLMTGSGPLDLRDSRIVDNRLFAEVESSEEVGLSGSAIDVYGPATISDTEIAGNDALVKSRDGLAATGGAVYSGLGTETVLITDSVIAGNTSRAVSATGQATVQGAGLLNDGQTRLRRVVVAGNFGRAVAPAGFARGGGIFSGRVFNEEGSIELALESTLVTRNVLSGSAGIDVGGGGIFNESAITLDDSRVRGNRPDDCQGC